MEDKKVAILVLAIAAALVLAVSAAYAVMGRQTVSTENPSGGATNRFGMGPSMMGGSGGYGGGNGGGMMGGYSGRAGGMMGGHGMMGNFAGEGSMYQHMQQMWSYWNSTATP